jgi:predicted DCC family thiol-disulfide oxidoreductase YuxK
VKPVARAAPVLLYDGVCGFCDRAVQFILRVDQRGTLRFAALDSTLATEVIDRHPALTGVDSVVYVEDPGHPTERVFTRSAAALRVVDYLGWPWMLLRAARVIPGPLLDRMYDGFAAIRYRVSGRYDTCPIPPPEVRRRFLDSLPR